MYLSKITTADNIGFLGGTFDDVCVTPIARREGVSSTSLLLVKANVWQAPLVEKPSSTRDAGHARQRNSAMVVRDCTGDGILKHILWLLHPHGMLETAAALKHVSAEVVIPILALLGVAIVALILCWYPVQISARPGAPARPAPPTLRSQMERTTLVPMTPRKRTPEMCIRTSFIVQQPEGLSLYMYGPELTSTPQCATLQVHNKPYGSAGEMQYVMDVTVAEQATGKCVFIEGGKLPVSYLDTTYALHGKQTHDGKTVRCIDIYDDVPERGRSRPHLCVRESGHRACEMIAVPANGKLGKLWYTIRYMGDTGCAASADVIDAFNILRGSMQLVQREGDDRHMYIIEVSPHVDASVILSGIIAAIKLS